MKIVKYLTDIQALPERGNALDVGPFHFKDSLDLVKAGFYVVTLEPREDEGEYNHRIYNFSRKLEEFDFADEKFKVILAGNVLQYTDDPIKWAKVLLNRLDDRGVMYVNFWGNLHEWASKHSTISMGDYLEFLEELQNSNSKYVILKNDTSYRASLTYSGEVVWWHEYQLVVKKTFDL